MNNMNFLEVLTNSFTKYLETSSRSNEKLKILHGAIAKHLAIELNNLYEIVSINLEKTNEYKMPGRYMDKNIDIALINKKNNCHAGIGVKFVMSNYKQNSNNYFENMLGETANLRANNIPYFQIIILLNNAPYYDNKQNIKHLEEINQHNINKYINLSKDNTDIFFHTPNKVLLYIIDLPKINLDVIKTKKDYINFYFNNKFQLKTSSHISQSLFNNNIILNNYEEFLKKVIFYLKSL